MQKLILDIEGLTDSGGERKLCRRICRLDGIKGVSARSSDGKLIAYYDEKNTDMKALLDSVTECGFNVI